MPTMPSDRFEFASDAWIQAGRQSLESSLKEADGIRDDLRFSICEIYTNVPSHLGDSNGGLAWFARIEGRSVTLEKGEIENGDMTIRADYCATLPVARALHAAGPEATARAHRESAKRLGGLPFQIAGKMPEIPALMGAFGRMHDELARRTVDCPDLAFRIEGQGLSKCTAIWALEDFSLEAGPTLVVPGSHELRRHPKPNEGTDRAVPLS